MSLTWHRLFNREDENRRKRLRRGICIKNPRPQIEVLEDRLLLSLALSPNERFVSQVFLDLVHRQHDDATMAAFSDMLDRQGAATRMRVVQSVLSTQEYRTVTVSSAYAQFLGRAPDPVG